jgi:hypothetical protein
LAARVVLAAGFAVRPAGFFAVALVPRVAFVVRVAAALVLRATGALAGLALAVRPVVPRLVVALIAIALPRGGVPVDSSVLIANLAPLLKLECGKLCR